MYKSTRSHIFLSIFLMSLISSSCLDPIELDIPKGQQPDAIVINAKIVQGKPSSFTLSLSKLFSFTTDGRARITAKNVTLSDEEGNEMIIKPTADGLYNYVFIESDPIKIKEGSAYSVKLQTFDGRTFISDFEPLLPVPKIENVKFKIVEKTFVIPDQSTRTATYMQYEIDTELTTNGGDEKSNLKWNFERVYKVTDTPIRSGVDRKVCYLTGNAGVFDVNIYSGAGTTKTKLENHILYDERIVPEYGEGLYFTIIQESLSSSAFEYWEKVKNVSSRKENIYSDPPGKVKSNFSQIDGDEEAFGFFYVTVQDTARIYVSPEAANFPSTRCPSEDLVSMDGSCGDPECCDCLSVDNSTTVKPEFWIF